MKLKLILGLAFSIFILGSWTNEPKENAVIFYEGTYDNFLREAKRLRKPVIIDFWASWCSPCVKMDNETFSDEDLGDYLNEKFLVYKVDIDSFEGMEIVEKFNVQAFPTILVADYRGNEISQLKGFYYPNYLERAIEKLKVK